VTNGLETGIRPAGAVFAFSIWSSYDAKPVRSTTD